jgi:molybdopterin-guanine dinucleotide biosynthesis protein A
LRGSAGEAGAVKNFGDAVILCGGKSERMNFDKSLLKINGKYMIEIISEKLSLCFENVKLGADSKERLSAFELEVIEDKIKGRIGPAAGIHSALAQAATKYVFVIACDMPLLNIGHIEYLKHALADKDFKPNALIPMNGGYIEPLYSFYSAGIAEMFAQEIGQGNYKIHNILKKCNALYLDDKYSKLFDESLAMFTNINCAADLEKF